ncbi:hypothetical protein [Streptomyces sp. IBSBF 2435]|uniref:hypothetical protein n=1 Tax=Streptomyces sp. IBSBF 2435 TaxID=2903531 RepID=UPI002FDBC09F
MPQHVLRPGREVIDSLVAIGRCLGYEVERERIVGNSGAAVDLAWSAAGEKWMPLMIFEVESRASGGMANNAMKVLAQDVNDFIKPLFFFHVVLKGGNANERVLNLRRQWGSHNYRVYTLDSKSEVQRLLLDILSQHRRITRDIDLCGISERLQTGIWENIDRMAIFSKIESLNFAANCLGDYARIALGEFALSAPYLDALESMHTRATNATGRYGGVLGDYLPGLTELSILIATGRVPDSAGPTRLEDWQNRSGHGMRTIGPYFGLAREYDSFVLGIAPFIYAMAGMTLRDKEESYRWLVSDLHSIVAKEHEHGISKVAIIPGALWLLHISASAIAIFPKINKVDESAYEFSRGLLNELGGIPLDVLDSPPIYLDVHCDEVMDEWIGRLEGACVKVPSWQELNRRYAGISSYSQIDRRDAFWASVELLLATDWQSDSNPGFLRELRKPPASE